MDFRVIYQGEKIMLIVREFSNRFQQMSGMPINSNETKERHNATINFFVLIKLSPLNFLNTYNYKATKYY